MFCTDALCKVFALTQHVLATAFVVWKTVQDFHFLLCVNFGILPVKSSFFQKVPKFGQLLNNNKRAVEVAFRGCTFQRQSNIKCRNFTRVTSRVSHLKRH